MAAAGGAGGLHPSYRAEIARLEMLFTENPANREIIERGKALLLELHEHFHEDPKEARSLTERVSLLLYPNKSLSPFQASTRFPALRAVFPFLRQQDACCFLSTSREINTTFSPRIALYSENFFELRDSLINSLDEVINDTKLSEPLRSSAFYIRNEITREFPNEMRCTTQETFAKSVAKMLEVFNRTPPTDKNTDRVYIVERRSPTGTILKKIDLRLETSRELRNVVCIESETTPLLGNLLSGILHSTTRIQEFFADDFFQSIGIALISRMPSLISDLATPNTLPILANLTLSTDRFLQSLAYYCLLLPGLDSIEHLPILDQLKILRAIQPEKLQIEMKLEAILSHIRSDISIDTISPALIEVIEGAPLALLETIRSILLKRAKALISCSEFELPSQLECRRLLIDLESTDPSDITIFRTKLVTIATIMVLLVNELNLMIPGEDREARSLICHKLLRIEQCRIINRLNGYEEDFRIDPDDLDSPLRYCFVNYFTQGRKIRDRVVNVIESLSSKELNREQLEMLIHILILTTQDQKDFKLCFKIESTLQKLLKRCIDIGELCLIHRLLVEYDPLFLKRIFTSDELARKVKELARARGFLLLSSRIKALGF